MNTIINPFRIKKITLFLATLLIVFSSFADNPIEKRPGRNKYVRRIMSTMTTKEMIGQLFMIDSYSTNDSLMIKKVLYQIDSNNVGGICFFKGTQKDLISLNNLYHQHSKIPLMISIDGEWGLNMRLDDASTFPMQLTMGALPKEDYNLVYSVGENIAKQCKSMGIDINFAPDVDINLNSQNPVINMRSFGQNKYKVAKLGSEYMLGMQDNGVMACAKHFPGHGDTKVDSHKATPIITHDKAFIDSVDSYPFRYLINKGIWSVMVGHLQVDALSEDTLKPASVNKDIISDYLIDDCNFEGLVFTDAMNMKGLTSRFGHGQAEILALKAGVDMILMADNIDTSINAILTAIDSGEVSVKFIKEKCRKILEWKYDMGILTKEKTFALPDSDLVSQAQDINAQIYEKALTALDSDMDITADVEDTVVMFLVGNTDYSKLINNIRENYTIETYRLNSKTTIADIDTMFLNTEHRKYYTFISGGKFAKSNTHYGIPKGSISIIEQIGKHTEDNVVVFFANPYTLKYIDTSFSFKNIICAYENNQYTQCSVADLIAGKVDALGSLPVTGNKELITDENLQQGEKLTRIDSIVLAGIANKAFPGCQVLASKDGKTIYDKCYGYYTYDSTKKVDSNTIYDIASLTKVMATTLAIMKLYEEGKIDLENEIKKYVPMFHRQKFGKLTVKELLSHYTTLPATFGFEKEESRDKMLKQLKKVNLQDQKYTYSDLNFLLLQLMVENVTKESLDSYVDKNFYKKMHLKNTTFNPLKKGFNLDNIAPTEIDTISNRGLIQGKVHDPMAYNMDGVCGNAGLFSSAKDLMKICTMLIDGGTLDGEKYLKKSTIDTFNHRYFANKNIRRALGFDKPLISSTSSHCSKYASQSSYGHSGFTGTYLWIDPDNGLIFIFLSNRVYPSATPNRLSKMNIRTEIHDCLYEDYR